MISTNHNVSTSYSALSPVFQEDPNGLPQMTQILLFNHNDMRYVWMIKGEAFKRKNTVQAVKHVNT